MSLLETAYRITNSLRLDAPRHDLAGVAWPQLLRHADGHSLTPLLHDVWRAAGALQDAPTEARERLARAHRDNGARNENIRRELLECHALLSEAGADPIVLKGWPLIERLYADPAQRVLYDHDFLLHEAEARAAHDALLRAGFRPRPTGDEWNKKHLPPVWRNDGYVWDGYLFDPHYPRPVELHVRLWETRWRGLHIRPLPDPWARAAQRKVAGRPMQVLCDEDTLIHLAMHFGEHLVQREARLNQLLDLARFVACTPQPDWAAVRARATAAGVARFVYAGLFLAHDIFGSPLPPEQDWAALAGQTSPALRAWLQSHGTSDVLTSDFRRPQHEQTYRLTFKAARTASEKIGILRFAALPPLAQLMKKYRVRNRWLGMLMYPRFMLERAGKYGRGLVSRT